MNAASQGTPVSVRMDPEIIAALRALAKEREETFSDVLRRAALQMLGACPTCGRAFAPEDVRG